MDVRREHGKDDVEEKRGAEGAVPDAAEDVVPDAAEDVVPDATECNG